jgi:formylglycine-generating enzyme required for sulfatase activity
MELVAIPPGEFMLGSTKEEQAWAVANGAKEEDVKREGEAPRKTRIKQGFWLGRTEVTVGQWKQFVAATGYKTDAEKKGYADYAPRKGQPWGRVDGLSWRDPGFGAAPRDDQPVCCVSWNDAVAFCEWATERERKAARLAVNQVVRLPTEAEWEYACRAGTDSKYYFGNDPRTLSKYAWFKENSNKTTHPVAQKEPNPWGLYDMCGNVAEWCHDFYSGDYYQRSGGNDPSGPSQGKDRVLRGGGWNSGAESCRSSARFSEAPGFADVCFGYDAYGFRCVRRTPPSASKY